MQDLVPSRYHTLESRQSTLYCRLSTTLVGRQPDDQESRTNKTPVSWHYPGDGISSKGSRGQGVKTLDLLYLPMIWYDNNYNSYRIWNHTNWQLHDADGLMDGLIDYWLIDWWWIDGLPEHGQTATTRGRIYIGDMDPGSLGSFSFWTVNKSKHQWRSRSIER